MTPDRLQHHHTQYGTERADLSVEAGRGAEAQRRGRMNAPKTSIWVIGMAGDSLNSGRTEQWRDFLYK